MKKNHGQAWDDHLTGEELDAAEVRRNAGIKEIGERGRGEESLEEDNCAERRRSVRRGTTTTVGIRWVAINKGDLSNPIFRSRLVAKEFNDIARL